MKINFLIVSAAGLLFGVSACMKIPEVPKNSDEPKVVTYDDLKIKSLVVSPDCNERIFGAVSFAPEADGLTWSAGIRNYRTDLSRLAASYEVVAAKVTVNEVTQESGVTRNDFTKPVIYRLYASDGQYKEYTATLTNSDYTGFPVLGIMTEGGSPVKSKEKWVKGRMVIDRQDGVCDELVCDIEIRGRGHSSWSLEKKPYAIRLAEKGPVMGMNKHKRWVLLANAADRTLMRNRVAFEMGRRAGMAWTPDSRYVDVVLNGTYLGNYLLCEQIRVDKNRVNIPEMTSLDITGEALTGGYLLEVDRFYDEAKKFRTRYRDLPVNISSPDDEVLAPAQESYIADYLNRVEELLYSGSEIDKSYTDCLDADSFIDWWFVVELAHNRDTRLPGSCYMYKDRGGRLFAGPLWDFDLMTFIPATGFLLKDYEVADLSKPGDRSLWYKRLFSDPVFRARVKERWQNCKPALEGIPAFIDTEAEKLEISADSNWALWTLKGGPNRDEGMSWRESLEAMKKNYKDRLMWMDGEIAKL